MSVAEPTDGEGSRTRLKVLFVCTHNAVRSPMARALCEARFGGAVESASAGVYVGEGVDPRAIAALAEIGVALEDHRPRGFADLERAGADLTDFDVVVALSAAAYAGAQRAARGGAIALELWPIDDPTTASPADEAGAHRAVRDALAARLDARFGAA